MDNLCLYTVVHLSIDLIYHFLTLIYSLSKPGLVQKELASSLFKVVLKLLFSNFLTIFLVLFSHFNQIKNIQIVHKRKKGQSKAMLINIFVFNVVLFLNKIMSKFILIMSNSQQKAKPNTTDLVVLQDAIQEFSNPISKNTFQALPRIYGTRKKKKYAIKYDFEIKDKKSEKEKYPIHHCISINERVVNSRIVKQVELDNQLSTKRYKTEIKKINRDSAEKLSKPKKEFCNRRYCFCHKEHNQTQMRSESKEHLKLNPMRGKSVRLPQIPKSPEPEQPDDVESKHKVSMIRGPQETQRKKRPLTLLDLLRSNQKQGNADDPDDQARSNRSYNQKSGLNQRHYSNKTQLQSVSVQTQVDPSSQIPIKRHAQAQGKPFGQKQADQSDGINENIQQNAKKFNQYDKKKDLKQNDKPRREENESAKKNLYKASQREQSQAMDMDSRSGSKIGKDGQNHHLEIQDRFAQQKQIFQNNQSSDSQMDDSRSIASSMSESSISKYVFEKHKNVKTIFQSLNKQQRKGSFDSKIRVKSEKMQKQEASSETKKKKEKFIFQKKNGLFVIPEEDEYVSYIKDYEPMSNKLKMKNLLKNQNFKVVKSDDGVYFGEVVDEKKHGKGIMVTQKTIFEGKYNSDIKIQGCQKNIDGVYRGEFVNGVREGYGTFQWNNGEVFEGLWKNGTKNGFGVWKSPKGDFYEGEWRLNRQHGKGVYKHRLSTYRGYFVDFLKNGDGEEIFTNGDRYLGLYKAGKPHGKGKYTWADGSSFEGHFVKGVREGFGIWRYSNGTVYEGEFQNDFKNGKGVERYKTGQVFEGLFKQGQKYEGTLYDANKNPIKITQQI